MASRMFCGALLGAPCIRSNACFKSAMPKAKQVAVAVHSCHRLCSQFADDSCWAHLPSDLPL